MEGSSYGHNAFQLSEKQVIDSFHGYLRSSLAQVKAERLIDTEMLSNAEADMMITAPALCLYFAALRSVTNPPSVPLPRPNKSSPPVDLSPTNCPPSFISFLKVWSSTVPLIQSLVPEHQHDLARVICGLGPVATPTTPEIGRIAAELRAVAIEISQRRTFQERFADDLQAAIDIGEGAPNAGRRTSARTTFVPPPSYEASTPSPSPQPSPRFPPNQLHEPPTPSYHSSSSFSSHPPFPEPAIPTDHLSPSISSPVRLAPPMHTSASPSSHRPELRPRTPSPTMLTHDSPAMEFIRETLYAAIGEVMYITPGLPDLLHRDKPRAYFASVSLAILYVARTAVTSDGSIVGVLGATITIADCPQELRPLFSEFANIGKRAGEMEEEDNEAALILAAQGADLPEPRMDRVKKILEEGVGYTEQQHGSEDGRRSAEGRAVAFANRINALTLKMVQLRTFRARQDDVFRVLGGIGR